MTNEQTEHQPDVNRRDVLKAVGGTAVGLSGATGVASAHERPEYNFYGCSQVCVNRRGVTAVVWTGRRFRYACIRRSSNRNDPPVRGWRNVYCYEVSGQEAIVGLCFEGNFIANPNRCAENYPRPRQCRDTC